MLYFCRREKDTRGAKVFHVSHKLTVFKNDTFWKHHFPILWFYNFWHIRANHKWFLRKNKRISTDRSYFLATKKRSFAPMCSTKERRGSIMTGTREDKGNSVYLIWVLLGTLDTNLSGRSTRNERKIVRSKGKEDSAVIVTNLSHQFKFNSDIFLTNAKKDSTEQLLTTSNSWC